VLDRVGTASEAITNDVARTRLRPAGGDRQRGHCILNQPQVSNLEDLTVGELRRALAQGTSEMTIREALAALDEADEVTRLHEQTSTSYRNYVEARLQRLAALEQEAMDEADREQEHSGRRGRAGRLASRHGGMWASKRGSTSSSTSRCLRGLVRGRSSRALQGGDPRRPRRQVLRADYPSKAARHASTLPACSLAPAASKKPGGSPAALVASWNCCVKAATIPGWPASDETSTP
jgi:hypothetical protein